MKSLIRNSLIWFWLLFSISCASNQNFFVLLPDPDGQVGQIERWDGTGYPEGLQGEKIPLFGRIMALVDVYDALICKRIYKPAFSHEEAVTFIVQQKGTFFDPAVVEAFLGVREEFKKIALTFADREEEWDGPSKNKILSKISIKK